ncbi:hypothetical protein, partial [Photorhabdus aegyptia]|uniref:hypothetical protein n=1 Tax=Photorhabdus aegyptia TaxID=2805098 RepID=UPI001E468D20
MKQYKNLPFIFSLIFLTFCYFSGIINYDIFTNSDVIYAQSLFRTIINKDSSIFDWHPSPSPYVIPDLLLYLAAYLIVFGKPMAAFYAYMILQYFIYFFSLNFLLKKLDVKKYNEISGWCVFITAIFSTLYREYSISLVPLCHFGIYTLVLISLGLIIDLQSKKELLMLIILSTLSSYSDNMYVIWFSIPIFISYSIISLIKRNIKIIKTPALLLISSFIGMKLSK